MGGLPTRSDETFVDSAGVFGVEFLGRRCQNRGGGQSSGISLGDALRLPKRHPAWRRREAQSGSGTERENLHGDAKGTGTSGSNRKAERTDAPVRGGLPRSSVEAG